MIGQKLQQKVALLALGAVLLFGTIGVVGMAYLNHTGMQHCPFAGLSSGNCMMLSAGTESVLHHIESFHLLLQGTVAMSIVLMLTLIGLAAVTLNLHQIKMLPTGTLYMQYWLHIKLYIRPPILLQFRHWLAQQNNIVTPSLQMAPAYHA